MIHDLYQAQQDYMAAVQAHTNAYRSADVEGRALMAAASRMSTRGLRQWAGRDGRLARVTAPEVGWREARDAFRTVLVRAAAALRVVSPADAPAEVVAFLEAAAAYGMLHRRLEEAHGVEGARRLRIAPGSRVPRRSPERQRRTARRRLLRRADQLVEAGIAIEPGWFA